jgi:hypothetical protein
MNENIMSVKKLPKTKSPGLEKKHEKIFFRWKGCCIVCSGDFFRIYTLCGKKCGQQ